MTFLTLGEGWGLIHKLNILLYSIKHEANHKLIRNAFTEIINQRSQRAFFPEISCCNQRRRPLLALRETEDLTGICIYLAFQTIKLCPPLRNVLQCEPFQVDFNIKLLLQNSSINSGFSQHHLSSAQSLWEPAFTSHKIQPMYFAQSVCLHMQIERLTVSGTTLKHYSKLTSNTQQD